MDMSYDDLIKVNKSLKEEIKCLEYDNLLFKKEIDKLKKSNDRLIKDYDNVRERYTQHISRYYNNERDYHRFLHTNAIGSRNWYKKRMEEIKNGQSKDSYIANIYQNDIKDKIVTLDKLSHRFVNAKKDERKDKILDKQISILKELKEDLEDIEYKTGIKHIHSNFVHPLKYSTAEVETYINLDYEFAFQMINLSYIKDSEFDNYKKGDYHQITVNFCKINNIEVV